MKGPRLGGSDDPRVAFAPARTRGRRRVRDALVMAAAVVGLAGCASRGTAIDKRMVLPPGAATMTLETRQGFLMAVPVHEPLPVLADDARGPDGRTEVCVEIVIDVEGQVSEARHMPGVDACDAQPDAGYAAAALAAVRQWTFFAAALCEFPGEQPVTEDCSGEGVTVRAVPIRLMYAFAFERSGGKARVRVRRAG